jgi:hypothetical protein
VTGDFLEIGGMANDEHHKITNFSLMSIKNSVLATCFPAIFDRGHVKKLAIDFQTW